MSRFFAFTTSALATVLITGLDGSVLAQITGQPTNNPNSLPNSISNSLQQPIGQSVSPNPTAALGRSNATYILGAGDQISLSVIGYPEFTGTLAILSDGTITLPLVGPLRVSGLTPNQLSLALTQRLRTYLIDPVVSVGLAVTRPVVVTIAGEVHRPGPIQLSGFKQYKQQSIRHFRHHCGRHRFPVARSACAANVELGSFTRWRRHPRCRHQAGVYSSTVA